METLAKDLENLARNEGVGKAIDDLMANPSKDEAKATLANGASVTIRRVKLEE